jgi:hypothetical protein
MLVKTIGSELTETGLFCEYFGNVVAREAGLLTPAPALIHIDLDTAHMINESTTVKAEKKTVLPGLAVGCEYLRPAPLPPRNTNLTSEQISEAAAIYVYDLLVDHPDRRTRNANLFMLRGHFVAFDFDMTFSFLWDVLGGVASAWEVSKRTYYADHYFYAFFRGMKGVDWVNAINRVLSIDTTKLEQLEQDLPENWRAYSRRAATHIRDVQSNADAFRWEVLRTVS